MCYLHNICVPHPGQTALPQARCDGSPVQTLCGKQNGTQGGLVLFLNCRFIPMVCPPHRLLPAQGKNARVFPVSSGLGAAACLRV